MKLDPAAKLFSAVIISASALFSSAIAAPAAVCIGTVCAAYAAGRGRKTLDCALLIAKLSALFFLMQLFSVSSGTVLFKAGFIAVTTGGLYAAALVTAKLTAASLPLMLVLSSVGSGELTNALAQHLRLPYKYAFALSAALRAVPMLSEEMRQVMEAQSARGVDFESGGPLKKAMMIVPLAAPLLFSSIRKTDASAVAAQMRGFDLRRADNCFRRSRFGAAEAGLTAASLLAAAAVTLI